MLLPRQALSGLRQDTLWIYSFLFFTTLLSLPVAEFHHRRSKRKYAIHQPIEISMTLGWIISDHSLALFSSFFSHQSMLIDNKWPISLWSSLLPRMSLRRVENTFRDLFNVDQIYFQMRWTADWEKEKICSRRLNFAVFLSLLTSAYND